MNINIMSKDTVLVRADETYIRNRLYFALAADHEGIDIADVSVCAVPGFDSERLHHCRVDIHLASGRAVIGDSIESDIYVAIDRAVDRASSKITSSASVSPMTGRTAQATRYTLNQPEAA